MIFQASKLKPHELEDGAKLENDKDETAARINDIVKRISEQKAQQTCSDPGSCPCLCHLLSVKCMCPVSVALS